MIPVPVHREQLGAKPPPSHRLQATLPVPLQTEQEISPSPPHLGHRVLFSSFKRVFLLTPPDLCVVDSLIYPFSHPL